MPPRFAYWTILIDNAPTAFRARDRADLAGIFRQLSNRNPNAEIKWFANGKLWNSPEEERAARARHAPREPRGPGWRPGGKHEDPRARFARRDRPPKGEPKRRVAPGGHSGGAPESGGPPQGRSPGQHGEPRRPARDQRGPERESRGKRFGDNRRPRFTSQKGQAASGQPRSGGGRPPRHERPDRRAPQPRGGQATSGRRAGPGDTDRRAEDLDPLRRRPAGSERDGERAKTTPTNDVPSEPEAPAPRQPPSPERPPKPGQEPSPETPAPETIRILPEPPERAKNREHEGSGAPPGARLVRKRR